MRVIGRDGRSQAAEVCLDCGGNARGSGRWVAASEKIGDRAGLPVWKDLRSPEERGEQGSLFGDGT